MALEDNIARLVAQREKDSGELEDEKLAKNKFRRDVIPSPGTALPGFAKPKKPTATVTSVERSRIVNETKIIQGIMEKMYPWMYSKPADEKGKTKIAERVTEDAKGAEERKTSVKKTVSTLGKILGAIALLTLGYNLFKDKIGELWEMFKGWLGQLWETIKAKLGELWDKFPGLFKLAIRGLLAAPLAALKLAIKGVKGAVKFGLKALLNPLGAMLDALKGLAKAIFSPIVKVVKGIATFLGIGKAAAKTGGKVAATAAETAAKQGGKSASKIAAKAGSKAAIKKIPVIGLLAGIGFGIARAAKGDWAGAGLEVASGAASTVPGVGTAASVGIDVGLLARDIKRAKEAEEVEDGIIGPDGGLLVQGRKGMFKLAKTDSVIAGELPNAGRKDNALSKIGKAMMGSMLATPLAAPALPFLAAGQIFKKMKQKREEIEAKNLAKTAAKATPLSKYTDYNIQGDSDITDILRKSDKTLQQIEKNTRAGMGPTIIPPGQGTTTQSRPNNQNTVAPNLNPGTGGIPKKDSRISYLDSPYSVTPNSLIT